MSSSIRTHNLSVFYNDKQRKTEAIRNLTMDLPEGGIYSIIGPSGCGKSTLLHVLAGIIKGYQGEVLINGTKPLPRLHSIGLVPQNYGLLPWKTVNENIFLAAKLKGIIADKAYSEEIIRTLGMEELLHRYPGELSGGQKQRAALARSFIQKPDLLLMDEPFSALDTFTAEKSRMLFLEIWKKHKVTTLFVTHNLEEAIRMGKKIILFSSSPGQIRRIIENPLFEKGADRSEEHIIRQLDAIKKLIGEEWG